MALMFILLLLHAYVGWRLIPALDFAPPLQWLIGGLLVASWLLMPMALLARRIRRQPLSDRLAWTGLLLMGLFSSLFVLTLMRDAVSLPLWVASFWWPLPEWLVPASAAAVPALAMLLTLWGLVNARRTARVVQVDVPIAQLPLALQGFSIAQISDVHVGPTIKRGYLQAIVERIISLAKVLHYTVVAEGVEDQWTLDLLASFGCDQAQGYHIARPMPAAAFQKWLGESAWRVPES